MSELTRVHMARWCNQQSTAIFGDFSGVFVVSLFLCVKQSVWSVRAYVDVSRRLTLRCGSYQWCLRGVVADIFFELPTSPRPT